MINFSTYMPGRLDIGLMSRPSGDLGQQAIRGVVSLGLREGGMKLVAFAGNIALFRLLTPADFGVIVPIAFLAGLVKQFADLGLQPSLIQRGSEPNSQDLRAVFTGQLGLVIIGGLLLFLGGPLVVDSVLNASIDPWMTRVFALSIFLSAFRVVPAALLERHLQFGRLATADILGSFCYFSLGIGFAIGAAGVWSLVIAHVGASIISTLAVVMARPWWPIPTMRLRVLRSHVNFGARFQGSRIALTIKDSLVPLFAPRAFGASATGLLSWANRVSSQPLVMTQLVARVSLPAFSRIQDNPEQVRRGAELTLKWNAIVTLPAFAALIAFGPEVASLIYGEQWLPAVPALYIFVLNSVLVPINGLITPILIAIGKTRVVLTVAVVWAIGAWVLAVGLMTAGVGFLAVPIALAVSQAVATMVLVPIGRREFELRVVRRLVRPFVAAVTAGVFGRFVLLPLLTDAVLLVQGCVVVAAVYLGVLYLIDRRAFQAELGSLRRRDGIGASS